MKDMIGKIVDAEKEARELTENVKQSKITVEQEIFELKKKIKEDYLIRARARIKINETTEQKEADKNWKEISKNQSEVRKKLNEIYKMKKSEWVAQIINNILEV